MTPRGLPTELRTDRLILRTWRPADRAPFAALNADPDVMRHLGGSPLDRASSDRLADRIEQHWRVHGFGLYAVERLDSRVFIGFVGVHHHPDLPDGPEIGWRIARDHWNLGLATEAARAVWEFAAARLRPAMIVSATAAQNEASRRVMEKLGLTLLRTESGPDRSVVVYGRRIDAADA